MPERYGNERITVLNSEVVKIDTENHPLAVKGGVPGARGSLVIIRSGQGIRKYKIEAILERMIQGHALKLELREEKSMAQIELPQHQR